VSAFYWVEHDDWDAPKKIFNGPNSNSKILGQGHIRTIGSSPECNWTLLDPSLPEIVAFIEKHRYRRIYLCELNPEDYGSLDRDDFMKRRPVLHKVLTSFEVAGYRFVARGMEAPDRRGQFDTLRAAYIKTWDGHMSPGDFEGYERDLAAHEAWKNGEDIFEIIRKEREGR